MPTNLNPATALCKGLGFKKLLIGIYAYLTFFSSLFSKMIKFFT